jgi:hypothetical protein
LWFTGRKTLRTPVLQLEKKNTRGDSKLLSSHIAERESIVIPLLLRIASLLTLLHGIGHTIGGVFSVDVPPGTPEGNVVAVMKSTHFDVMGATRTYWDFFFGFGLIITVSLLIQTILFWQLAGLAKTDAKRLRPIIAVFFLGHIGYAILAWRFFFAPPLIGSVLTAIALGLAYVRAGVPKPSPESS